MSSIDRTKLVDFKELVSEFSFTKVDVLGKEVIIGVKPVITMALMTCNNDGSPKIIPPANKPSINFQITMVQQEFTQDQYLDYMSIRLGNKGGV